MIECKDRRELKTFQSDYNNLGTTLRKPDADARLVPQDPFFRDHDSKAVISLNDQRYNGLAAWRKAASEDLHSIFQDPRYVDAEHRDFRLQPDSPNLHAGENGATIGALGD